MSEQREQVNGLVEALKVSIDKYESIISEQREHIDILVDALNNIICGCERRLMKGPDNGDQETLRYAKEALFSVGLGRPPKSY